MDKILWIIISMFVIILMRIFKIREKYMAIFFTIVLLLIFRDSYLEVLLFIIQIILPTVLIIGAGYYITKYKMMMHGGSYRSTNFTGGYEYKKSSYEEKKEENKNTNENKRKNYEYEGTLKGDYDELGIDYNISDEGLKKNHKKLARMYHPDMHSDKSEKEQKIYEEKFKKINEAYENIKKYRGI